MYVLLSTHEKVLTLSVAHRAVKIVTSVTSNQCTKLKVSCEEIISLFSYISVTLFIIQLAAVTKNKCCTYVLLEGSCLCLLIEKRVLCGDVVCIKLC